MKICHILIFSSIILANTLIAQETKIEEWKLPFSESSGVKSLSLAPNGRVLAMANSRYAILLYDIENQVKLQTLSGHVNHIESLAFSQDGKYLASGSRDKSIKIWRIKDGSEVATLSGHAHDVTCLAFSPDNEILASGGRDRTVRLWSIAKKKQLKMIVEHKTDVETVLFSSDGVTLVTRSRDGAVKFWKLRDREGKHVVSSQPQDAEFYYKRGNEHKAQGNLDDAVKDLKRCLEINPKMAEAHYRLACIYSLQEEIVIGISHLEKAIANGYTNWERFRYDPDLASLRTTPKFRKLTRLQQRDNGTSDTSPPPITLPENQSGVTFQVSDTNGNQVIVYEILAGDKVVSPTNAQLAPGEYNFTFRFKNYKTITRRLYFSTSAKVFALSLPVERLNSYQFSLRTNEIELNGIKYPYKFFIDNKPVEPHLVDKEKKRIAIGYTIRAEPSARHLQVYGGYTYAQQKLIRLKGTIKRLDKISIPMLIRHLDTLTARNHNRSIVAMQTMEKLLKSYYWSRKFKYVPALELLPLLEYVENWEFYSQREKVRRDLLISLLRDLIEK